LLKNPFGRITLPRICDTHLYSCWPAPWSLAAGITTTKALAPAPRGKASITAAATHRRKCAPEQTRPQPTVGRPAAVWSEPAALALAMTGVVTVKERMAQSPPPVRALPLV
jgi:hypothetical protein